MRVVHLADPVAIAPVFVQHFQPVDNRQIPEQRSARLEVTAVVVQPELFDASGAALRHPFGELAVAKSPRVRTDS